MRQVVGSKTYTLETLKGEVLRDNSNQDMRISGEELVRVEMPSLQFDWKSTSQLGLRYRAMWTTMSGSGQYWKGSRLK